MENKQHLYHVLAQAIEARLNCKSGDANESQKEWFVTWSDRINELVDMLPSGSGWDCGTKIDLDKSHATKIVLYGSYHHMHESGMYDGWTDHTITVTPSFSGINIRISGRNRNDIKDYLAETFDCDLCQYVMWDTEAGGYVRA